MEEMKLEYTYGCVCDSLSVDGIESIDINIEGFRAVIHNLIDKIDEFAVLQDLFCNCMEALGEYESHGPCDCCGDYITTYTYEI